MDESSSDTKFEAHSQTPKAIAVSLSAKANVNKDVLKSKGSVGKRSRTGCLTCRKRRIKCDEGKPTCKNCLKSKRECEGYHQRLIFKEPQAMNGRSQAGVFSSHSKIPPQAYDPGVEGDLEPIAPRHPIANTSDCAFPLMVPASNPVGRYGFSTAIKPSVAVCDLVNADIEQSEATASPNLITFGSRATRSPRPPRESNDEPAVGRPDAVKQEESLENLLPPPNFVTATGVPLQQNTKEGSNKAHQENMA
ncbi:hypothetical protein B0H63DRAFT_98397 [Podospora didyma]|uniref:Zn(2)-C6 fungal-type domain-containing protein n=1 Tax=Podospora didyma TaxID=330526 RepID=A0AAE0NX65_9PEZI|nr:hypothetical protein B0H63DRAFT_98397 [Podospora didyma]